MQTWRYKAKAVTKYNTVNYDENDCYTVDEWTGYCDIGKVYGGITLSLESYLQIEEAYISAIKVFMQLVKTNSLELFEVFKTSKKKEFKDANTELYAFYRNIKDGNVYQLEEIDPIIKLALRERVQLSCLIDIETNSRVYFGYDYYMYFVSDLDLSIINQQISELGLFLR